MVTEVETGWRLEVTRDGVADNVMGAALAAGRWRGGDGRRVSSLLLQLLACCPHPWGIISINPDTMREVERTNVSKMQLKSEFVFDETLEEQPPTPPPRNIDVDKMLTIQYGKDITALQATPWFHGLLGRDQAEERLTAAGLSNDGVFLVRLSQSQVRAIVLLEPACLTVRCLGSARAQLDVQEDVLALEDPTLRLDQVRQTRGACMRLAAILPAHANFTCIQGQPGHTFNIDSGPHFTSISAMVDHYGTACEQIPTKLLTPCPGS